MPHEGCETDVAWEKSSPKSAIESENSIRAFPKS